MEYLMYLYRYNFTVNEEEPLEKEVALDPELLGKIYEKLNAIRPDNFDEYMQVLKSGKKGEETKFNKEYGVYYTPREIVHYMCQQSLINYLSSSTDIPVCDIEKFIKLSDSIQEIELTAIEKQELIEKGQIKSTKYESQIPESIKNNDKRINNLLSDIKVCDPAVGSGAFPIGMMHEIVKLRKLLSVYLRSRWSNTGIPTCERSSTGIPTCERSSIGIPAHEDIHITHRNLPHWTKQGAIYWVTFRLADSLPQEKIERWKDDYEIWLKNHPKPWSDKERQEYNEQFGECFEKWLDVGYGSCILASPEVREIMKKCIMKYDGERFKIHAVVIMPNHVHLLIEPFKEYSLSQILKGIKGASAHEMNKVLGKKGEKIWMEESYDHIVRSEKEYFHFINYIQQNPAKANLSEEKYWLYITQAFLPVVDKDTQTGMSVLPYDLKRHCIENSLYGVDIDPGAVEICKLRFWLSMIVDEEDFHNITPLPNLDYKVVCGNSLLGVEKDLFNNDAFSKLEKLKPQYFNETNPIKKQQLRTEIDKLIYEITKGHKEFDFEVYFSEVFHKKVGFDVVIANPPYVRQERIKHLKPDLQKAGYDIYNSTSDLYTYFYEKGWKILKLNGHFCFISSNKWMRAKYGEKLRRFLKQKSEVVSIIDFGGYPVFEATVDTNIILFKKKSSTGIPACEVKFVNVQSLPPGEDLISYIENNYNFILQEKLDDKCWTLADDKVLKLKAKIERIGKPLKDWNAKIYRGVLTGYNEAFIIDMETRNKILQECETEEERKRTEEIIKPILRGRDIGRYYYKWAGLWLIKIESGWTNTNRGRTNPEEFFKRTYPAIYNHLLQFAKNKGKGKGLFNRDDQGDYWWELRDCSYYPEFEKEKIVWQRVTQKFSFCLVPEGFYILDSMAFLRGNNLKFLIGILNSTLIDPYVKTYVHQYADTGFLLSNQYVERIPIPPITSQNQHTVKQIETIVSQIFSLTQSEDYLENPQKQEKVKEYERQIDRLVYKLYGLTDEEIKIVEGEAYGKN